MLSVILLIRIVVLILLIRLLWQAVSFCRVDRSLNH